MPNLWLGVQNKPRGMEETTNINLGGQSNMGYATRITKWMTFNET